MTAPRQETPHAIILLSCGFRTGQEGLQTMDLQGSRAGVRTTTEGQLSPSYSQAPDSGFVQGENTTPWLCCDDSARPLHPSACTAAGFRHQDPPCPHAAGCTHLFIVCLHGDAHLLQVGGLHVGLQFAGNPSSELTWWDQQHPGQAEEERLPEVRQDSKEKEKPGMGLRHESILLEHSHQPLP